MVETKGQRGQLVTGQHGQMGEEGMDLWGPKRFLVKREQCSSTAEKDQVWICVRQRNKWY